MASWQYKALRPLLRYFQHKVDLTRPIEQQRAAFEALTTRFGKRKGMLYEPVQVADMEAEQVRLPLAPQHDIILNLHSGAFIIGSYKAERLLSVKVARLTGRRVLTPNYRLAPEHPFPAAVEDALSAYRWLLDRGIEPTRIIVMGASAGGALTLGLLLQVRDLGLPLPVAAVCLCPVFDLTITAPSIERNAASDVILTRALGEYGVSSYLQGTDPKTPLASPLFADLHGLPPLFIQAGSGELLLDDAVRFAERAREAGVEVELEIWPEMCHTWQVFAPIVPEARQAMEHVSDFVLARLSPIPLT